MIRDDGGKLGKCIIAKRCSSIEIQDCLFKETSCKIDQGAKCSLSSQAELR